tara:strand:- start:184 stop:828 length:645 start_codon:yes stop_codon:yes gene_type:complete
MDAKEKQARFIKEEVQAILKPLGYRKKNQYFYQHQNDLVRVLHFWKWKYNSVEEARFQLDIGIFVPKVAQVFWKSRNLQNPTLPDCLLYLVASDVDPELPHQYTTNDQVDEARVAPQQKSLDDLSDTILPFLSQWSDSSEVVETILSLDSRTAAHWDKAQGLEEQTAALCAIHGQKDLAIRLFAKVWHWRRHNLLQIVQDCGLSASEIEMKSKD